MVLFESVTTTNSFVIDYKKLPRTLIISFIVMLYYNFAFMIYFILQAIVNLKIKHCNCM